MTSPTETRAVRDRLVAYGDGLGLAPRASLALALEALDMPGGPSMAAAMGRLFGLLRQRGLDQGTEPLASAPPLNRQSMLSEK